MGWGAKHLGLADSQPLDPLGALPLELLQSAYPLRSALLLAARGAPGEPTWPQLLTTWDSAVQFSHTHLSIL